jgi:hypothetical protein
MNGAKDNEFWREYLKENGFFKKKRKDTVRISRCRG